MGFLNWLFNTPYADMTLGHYVVWAMFVVIVVVVVLKLEDMRKP